MPEKKDVNMQTWPFDNLLKKHRVVFFFRCRALSASIVLKEKNDTVFLFA